jgi:hypothetical protein
VRDQGNKHIHTEGQRCFEVVNACAECLAEMRPAAGDVFLPVQELADRLANQVCFSHVTRFFFEKLLKSRPHLGCHGNAAPHGFGCSHGKPSQLYWLPHCRRPGCCQMRKITVWSMEIYRNGAAKFRMFAGRRLFCDELSQEQIR